MSCCYCSTENTQTFHCVAGAWVGLAEVGRQSSRAVKQSNGAMSVAMVLSAQMAAVVCLLVHKDYQATSMQLDDVSFAQQTQM